MLLIARAPTRISLGGGGTDLPAYYERYGGLVVSASVGYAFHTLLENTAAGCVQIRAADHQRGMEELPSSDGILDECLQLPTAIVDFFRPANGLKVLLACEVPSGSGLGVCGAQAVSMVKALSFWCGVDLDPAAAADIACQIQIDRMGAPVGKQDEYAAAFGGLNSIEFSGDAVSVVPLNLPTATESALQERLMLFYTGVSRASRGILDELQQGILDGDGKVLDKLKRIKDLAADTGRSLQRGDFDAFGELLHESWSVKRDLVNGISSDLIDECYELARTEGAKGGTLSGAGGGGFLILYCPEESQEGVTRALERLGVRRWSLALNHAGVQLMQAKPWQRLDVNDYG